MFWAPQGPLDTTTRVLVKNTGSRTSQTWAQLSGVTLISCVTLDKTHFLSEVQKMGIMMLDCLSVT